MRNSKYLDVCKIRKNGEFFVTANMLARVFLQRITRVHFVPRI